MQRFYQFGFRKTDELKALNLCRLYLHAVTLSDIATARGTHILSQAWDGSDTAGRRNFIWQRAPPKEALNWKLWQEALRICFGLDRHNNLAIPLGQWHDLAGTNCWYYSPSCQRLLRQSKDRSWRSYQQNISVRGKTKFNKHSAEIGFGKILLSHGDLHIADVHMVRNQLVMTGYDEKQIVDKTIPFPFKKRPNGTTQLGWLAHTWFTDHSNSTFEGIANDIANNTCIGVSDGSAFEKDQGTAAWCIGSVKNFESVSAGLRVPGPDKSQCSYRSELAGILAILTCVRAVSRDYHITAGAVEIGTDSQSVLDCLFE